MKAFKLFCILTLGLLLSNESYAQFRNGYFSVGVGTGVTHYLGDLDEDFTLKFTKPGLSVWGAYRFNPFMTARLSFFQGWTGASDENSNNEARRRRNLSFRSPITEFSTQLVIDFIPNERSFYYRPKYTPYIFGGIAIFSFNPQAQLNGEWVELQPLGTEGQFLPDPNNLYDEPYNLTQISIPMGAGVRVKVTRNIDVAFETGFRKTFTDHIDDVSHLYPDLNDLRAQNPTAALLSDRIDLTQFPDGAAAINGVRGDRAQTDWYIFTGITVSYVIDWVKCPSF